MLKSRNRKEFIFQGVLITVILVIIGVILVSNNSERTDGTNLSYSTEPYKNIKSNHVNDKLRNIRHYNELNSRSFITPGSEV